MPLDPDKRLPADDADMLVGHVGAAMAGELPLEDTLDALADDAGEGILATTARQIASALRRGEPLEQAARTDQNLPDEIQGLLSAGLRCGNPTAIFESYARERMVSRRLRRTIRSASAYPLLILAFLIPISLFFSLLVIPTFADLYEDYALELAPITQFVITAAERLPVWILGMCLIPLTLMFSARILGGRWLWHRLRGSIPVLGALWIWLGQREFAALMAALLEQEIPLDEALEHAGRMLADRNVGRACGALRTMSDDGLPLSGCLQESIHFDRTLAVLVAWGETHNRVADALRQTDQVFVDRIEQATQLIRRLLPPFALVIFASTSLVVILSLVLPMISMIDGLV